MVDRFSRRRADTILDRKNRHWVRELYRGNRLWEKRDARRMSRHSAAAFIRAELEA